MAAQEPCPYCGPPMWNLLSVGLFDDEVLSVDITGNLLRAYVDSLDDHYTIETLHVNFCPVCGAKLPRKFP